MQDYDGTFQVEHSLENWKPVIHFFRRVDGEKIITKIRDFKPYFYIHQDEKVDVSSLPYGFDRNIEKIEEVEGKLTLKGEKVRKITLSKPSDVYKLKQILNRTYEADIMYTIRYMIDNVKKIDKQGDYRVCYLDIETTMIGGFPDKDNPLREIISITCYDNYSKTEVTLTWREDFINKESVLGVKSLPYVNGGEEFNTQVYFFQTEQEMLVNFIKLISKVWDSDIITAWNVNFDVCYLLSRMKHLGINTSPLSCVDGYLPKIREFDAVIPGRVIFDLLGAYKKIHLSTLRSFSLASVAKDELGASKLSMKITDKQWKNDINNLIEYNQRDVDLLVGIDEKLKIIDYFDEMRRMVVLDNLNSCLFYSRVIDTLILRKYKDIHIFPSKNVYRQNEEEIAGGYVAEPKVGFHENVIVFDFKALYPSLILTFNLSTDVICDDSSVKIQNTCYSTKKQGILPSIIDDLIKLRKRDQDIMHTFHPDTPEYKMWWQRAFARKFLVNTCYGVNALPSFRMFDERVANAITYMGRTLIQWCTKLIESKGYEVIYNDTDSMFIKVKNSENIIKDSEQLVKELNEKLNDFVNIYGLNKHYLKVEFEKVYQTFLLLSKKRYAGHKVWYDDKDVDMYDYVGVDLVRSDVTDYAKEIQGQVIKMILNKKLQEEIFIYIREKANNLKKMSVENIAIPTKLEKDEYKMNYARIRAKDWSNDNIGTNFRAGSKFLMLYTKRDDTDVIAFDEVSQLQGIDLKLDYEKLIEVNIYDKLQTIMTAMNWDTRLQIAKCSSLNILKGQKELGECFK